MAASRFRRYLLPGLVFQSVVIAGGYGTGRELVEFFLTLGPRHGLAAMLLVSAVVWSLVTAVSLEFARRFRAFEYRRFFRALLGPGWIAFELCYLALLFVVLAVIGAAAGAMLEETFGLPYALGVGIIMAAVGLLVFRGSATIEKALAGWSGVLYLVYLVLFVWSFARFGGDIREALAAETAGGPWVTNGLRYAAYNLAVIPAVLFTVRHIETRREALTAGLLAGPIAIVPGLLFYLAMAGQYPMILDRAVPANLLLELLGSRIFQIVFQVVLFGTLIETGAGLIHAVNERIAAAFADHGRALPDRLRPAVAVVLLLAAALLARVGLVALIARGYGTLTWLFLIVYVVPVLTWGVWRLLRDGTIRPLHSEG